MKTCRKVEVKAKASFECGSCYRTWSSNNAWITFDMIHQRVVEM